jgi:hypothetical protein
MYPNHIPGDSFGFLATVARLVYTIFLVSGLAYVFVDMGFISMSPGISWK